MKRIIDVSLQVSILGVQSEHKVFLVGFAKYDRKLGSITSNMYMNDLFFNSCISPTALKFLKQNPNKYDFFINILKKEMYYYEKKLPFPSFEKDFKHTFIDIFKKYDEINIYYENPNIDVILLGDDFFNKSPINLININSYIIGLANLSPNTPVEKAYEKLGIQKIRSECDNPEENAVFLLQDLIKIM